MYQHPQVPWVVWQPQPNGGAVAQNTRTGEQAFVANDLELNEFAARAARAPGYNGAGDAVASLATRLGFGKCAPCAARQAALNRMAPRMYRRR